MQAVEERKTFEKESIPIPDVDYRITMLRVERWMRQHPLKQDRDFYPLKHTFAHGMYIREIFVPAGHLVLTFVHKQSHPCFVLKGDTSVIEPTGNKRVSAPYHFITPAGTQRLVFCHTDTVWATVHLNLTNEKDIDKIEKDIYAVHYQELFNEQKSLPLKESDETSAL